MLRDLGNHQDTHVLSGHLDARFTGQPLRFPRTFAQLKEKTASLNHAYRLR